jgi:hypothetical protein
MLAMCGDSTPRSETDIPAVLLTLETHPFEDIIPAESLATVATTETLADSHRD